MTGSCKPILFSAPMVRALLHGHKSQTRRVLKPQPDGLVEGQIPNQLRIQTGDRLWVRETWGSLQADHTHACHEQGYRKPQQGDKIVYHADPASAAQWGSGLPSQGSFMWRPSIHMPRWASRITLNVTDVRVQRLQDISRGDAMEEGSPFPNMAKGPNPIDWYADLWDKINGPGAWAENPWVVAYTFTVERRNIDVVVS